MLLEIEDISKVYRKGIRANDGVSLSVGAGEVFGLLGPNGAGKTTLVNQIMGLLKPTSGTIRIDGTDVIADPGFARQACSLQAQVQVPIEGLTILQAIELAGRVRGGRKAEVLARARELVDNLDIGEWANKRGDTLSGGVLRLASFCMAAVVPGRVVILDEPTNDVDPLRRRLLWQEVRALKESGSAVLLITHNVLEAERAVDRLAIIDMGKVLGQGTPASLKEHEAGFMRLELVFEPMAKIPAPPEFINKAIDLGSRSIGIVSAQDVCGAIDWASELRESGIVEEFTLGPSSLEDAYIRLIGREEAIDPGTEGAQ
ncbi:MAG: ABC transporter ATP-binding protein [Actinomycetota bacterium]|nr:ABC transporter ATP-binding protein [Actinomycetota bacterium]MDD5667652.1 ABC transporter ATP-binding protein [Actinomycetota bacterium]